MPLAELALLDALGSGHPDVAEPRRDSTAGFVLGHAARQVFGDAHLGVEAQLLLHVVSDVAAPEGEIAAPSGYFHAALSPIGFLYVDSLARLT